MVHQVTKLGERIYDNDEFLRIKIEEMNIGTKSPTKKPLIRIQYINNMYNNIQARYGEIYFGFKKQDTRFFMGQYMESM
jgi:hypothetical protein